MVNEGMPKQTSRVDWLYLALVSVMVVPLFALLIVAVRVYVNRGYYSRNRRLRKPTSIRHAKGEYHPPEPPEGRYWG